MALHIAMREGLEHPETFAITIVPAPLLRETAPEVDVELLAEHGEAVFERMLEIMHEQRGVGIAAPQWCVGRRFCVFFICVCVCACVYECVCVCASVCV